MSAPSEHNSFPTWGSKSGDRKVVSPLAQMIDRLRHSQYVATAEERHVLSKCSSRMRKYGLEGFVAGGSVFWTVTGGLNLLWRLPVTIAGAAAGGFWLSQLAVKPCIEDILSLDRGRFQEELVAILQKDLTHSTRARKILQKHYYLEPLFDDKSQDMPSVTLRKRQSTRGATDDSSLEVWGEEEHVHSSEPNPSEPLKSASSVTDSNVHIQGGHLEKNNEEVELFLDPFDMLALSGPAQGSRELENKGIAAKRHRSRISVNERREYNKMRYQQWKEKQRESSEQADFDYTSY